MRIRPFFWFLLAFACTSVLIFAAIAHPHAPVVLQAHVDELSLVSAGMTSVQLRLTDQQGLPIEKARISPGARMTNMDMSDNGSVVRALGDGNYFVQLHLYMAGPWAITIQAYADGFAPQQQTLQVQVK